MKIAKLLARSAVLWALSWTVSSATEMSDLTFYTEEYPPYNFENNGQITGIAVDLLLQASEQVGGQIANSQIIMQPWPRAYRSALLKPDSVLFSATRTQHREALFNWVGPIGDIRVSVLARSDTQIKIDQPIDLAKYRIGVIRDDVGEQLLLQLGIPRELMQEAANVGVLTELLLKNRIDLIAYNEQATHWWAIRAGYQAEDFATIYVLQQGLLYFAFNKGVDQQLLNDLQKGIDIIRDTSGKDGVNLYQAILNKYR